MHLEWLAANVCLGLMLVKPCTSENMLLRKIRERAGAWCLAVSISPLSTQAPTMTSDISIALSQPARQANETSAMARIPMLCDEFVMVCLAKVIKLP